MLWTWPYGRVVKTLPSQGGSRGSNPLRATIYKIGVKKIYIAVMAAQKKDPARAGPFFCVLPVDQRQLQPL